jgi:hypothetical protein
MYSLENNQWNSYDGYPSISVHLFFQPIYSYFSKSNESVFYSTASFFSNSDSPFLSDVQNYLSFVVTPDFFVNISEIYQ